MVKDYKFVRLEEETHALLDAVRKKDETYNVVILKLLALSNMFDKHVSVQSMIAVEDTDELFDLEQKEREKTMVCGNSEDFSRDVCVPKNSKIGKMLVDGCQIIT